MIALPLYLDLVRHLHCETAGLVVPSLPDEGALLQEDVYRNWEGLWIILAWQDVIPSTRRPSRSVSTLNEGLRNSSSPSSDTSPGDSNASPWSLAAERMGAALRLVSSTLRAMKSDHTAGLQDEAGNLGRERRMAKGFVSGDEEDHNSYGIDNYN